MGDFWALADKIGFTAAGLVLAVVMLYSDLLVSGKRYREVVRQRDALLRVALSGTRVGERSATVATRALDILAQHSEGQSDDDLAP